MEYWVASHSLIYIGHYLGADSQSVEGKKRDKVGVGAVGVVAAVLSIFYVLIIFYFLFLYKSSFYTKVTHISRDRGHFRRMLYFWSIAQKKIADKSFDLG